WPAATPAAPVATSSVTPAPAGLATAPSPPRPPSTPQRAQSFESKHRGAAAGGNALRLLQTQLHADGATRDEVDSPFDGLVTGPSEAERVPADGDAAQRLGAAEHVYHAQKSPVQVNHRVGGLNVEG